MISDQFYKNDDFFNQLLNKSSKVKIHTNQVQQNSSNRLVTQQNTIKSIIDSTSYKHNSSNYKQKIDIKNKYKGVASVTKTPLNMIWWLIFIVIIIGIYLLNKLNIITFVSSLFKHTN